MTTDPNPTTPPAAAIRALAERMARENDVNARDAEYAIKRLLAHGMIEIVEVKEPTP